MTQTQKAVPPAIPAKDGVDVLVHAAPEMGRAVVMLFNGGWNVSAWMTPEAMHEMARRCEAAAAVLDARPLEDGK